MILYRMFQRMSGLKETGVLSDDVFQQTLVSRCGGLDVFHDHNVLDHPFKVLRYHIQQYPDPETSLSELTREEIDEVVLAASQQWTDPRDERPRLVRSDSKEDSDIVIVFCSFAQCLAGYRKIELARPAFGSGSSDHPMLMSGSGVRGARMTVYLDSQQAWASEDTLTSLAYGAAFNVHTQLLQVKEYSTFTFTLLTSPSPSPSPKSKSQTPKSQIQKGKRELGPWAVTTLLWATTNN